MNTTILKQGDAKQYDCLLGIGLTKGQDKEFWLKMYRLQKKENVRTLMDIINGIANGIVRDNIKRD